MRIGCSGFDLLVQPFELSKQYRRLQGREAKIRTQPVVLLKAASRRAAAVGNRARLLGEYLIGGNEHPSFTR